MRLAILLSGHIRSLEVAENNISSLKKIFPNVDIYIHTWSITEMSGPSHQEPKNKSRPLNKEIFENLQIDDYLIESQDEALSNLPISISPLIDSLKSKNQPAVNGFIWMIYGIKQATELMRKKELINEFVYDYVIRYRFDLVINSVEKLVNYLNLLLTNNNKIILSSNNNWWPLGCYSDIFWISNRNNHIKIINRIYDNFEYDIKQFSKSNIFLPELIFTNVIKHYNITITEIEMISSLKRENYLEKISYKHKNIGADIEAIAFCWSKLAINFYSDGFWATVKRDPLRLAWKKNSIFLLKSLNVNRVLYNLYILYKKIRNIYA